jgi:hypothetical protein
MMTKIFKAGLFTHMLEITVCVFQYFFCLNIVLHWQLQHHAFNAQLPSQMNNLVVFGVN